MVVVPRHGWALVAALVLVGVDGRARAQTTAPLQVALDYQVDPSLSGCPSAADLSAATSKQLGYDPFVADGATRQHRLRASIQRTASGSEAHLEWLDVDGKSEGERRLTDAGDDCQELARGLSFAIAVQIQLRASSEAPAAAATPVSAAAKPAAQPAPGAAKPQAPSKRSSVLVGAGVLVQRGLTPGAGVGPRVFGALAGERLSLELSTAATLPSQQIQADGTGFSSWALTAELAPCAHLSVLGLCAVGMLGELNVRGQGVDHVQTPSSFVAAGGARLQLRWPGLSRLGLLVQLEALALATPRTILVNQEAVWSTAPFVLGLSFDLAAVFP